jgi:proline iminopeptidase
VRPADAASGEARLVDTLIYAGGTLMVIQKIGRIIKTLIVVLLFLLLIMFLTAVAIGKAIWPRRAVVLPARLNYRDTVAASTRMNRETARIIKANDFHLWFQETGNPQGETVIVIHGGPGLSSYYFHNYLDFLKKDYHVILYDQRGCGLSEFKSDCRWYTFSGLENELDAIIKSYVKGRPLILLGHSFGATIALQYALDHPAKVAKLILVSNTFIKAHSDLLIPYFRKLYQDSFPPLNDPEATNQWYHDRLAVVYGRSFYNPVNRRLLDIGDVSYATALHEMKSMRDFDLEARLPGFVKPTLSIYGARELETFAAEDQIILHRKLKNSQLVRFAHSGHWSFMEEPEKFRETVLNFLKK